MPEKPYRPRAGDRKNGKDGRVYIRRAKVFLGPGGQVVGYDCTHGKQRYVWVPEDETYPQVSTR